MEKKKEKKYFKAYRVTHITLEFQESGKDILIHLEIGHGILENCFLSLLLVLEILELSP